MGYKTLKIDENQQYADFLKDFTRFFSSAGISYEKLYCNKRRKATLPQKMLTQQNKHECLTIKISIKLWWGDYKNCGGTNIDDVA